MGYRTVVIFNNDRHSDWAKDPSLGSRISEQMNRCRPDQPADLGNGGYVVRCDHMDVTEVCLLRDLTLKNLTYGGRGNTPLELLREAASELGYRLVKKSRKN